MSRLLSGAVVQLHGTHAQRTHLRGVEEVVGLHERQPVGGPHAHPGVGARVLRRARRGHGRVREAVQVLRHLLQRQHARDDGLDVHPRRRVQQPLHLHVGRRGRRHHVQVAQHAAPARAAAREQQPLRPAAAAQPVLRHQARDGGVHDARACGAAVVVLSAQPRLRALRCRRSHAPRNAKPKVASLAGASPNQESLEQYLTNTRSAHERSESAPAAHRMHRR